MEETRTDDPRGAVLDVSAPGPREAEPAVAEEETDEEIPVEDSYVPI